MKSATRCRLFVSTWMTFGLFACSGTDNLTDPVVTSGGNTSVPTGGNTSSAGVGSAPANAGASTFDWGTTPYDATRGASIAYQNHFNGVTCVSATCHAHTIRMGGTVYQADGVTPAANVQIGIFINGQLSTTYTGTQGNFYSGANGVTNWSVAQIALRTSTGTVTMPVGASASGDCNTCHDATHRITVP